MPPDRADHWNSVYATRPAEAVTWFEAVPQASLDMIARTGIGPDAGIVDVGGGASRLAETLLARGHSDITVLDLSETALHAAQDRLGDDAARVTWIAADATRWTPARRFDLWHDRAAFHFLTDPADQRAYVTRMADALKPGGWAVIATFAPDGPERCSGLPVMRQDAATLAQTLGPAFRLVHAMRHLHRTPSGGAQPFQVCLFRRARS